MKTMIFIMAASILLTSCAAGRVGVSERCDSCHGTPPLTGAHRIHYGGSAAATYEDTSNASSGRIYRFNCGNCHPLNRSKHEDGKVEVELYNPKAKGLKALNPPDAHYNMQTTVCTNVYCHSSGQASQSRIYVPTPPWTSSFAQSNIKRCQGCHGSPPIYQNEGAGSQMANSHYRGSSIEDEAAHLLGIHWDSVGGHNRDSLKIYKTSSTMGCSTCHNKTVSDNTDGDNIDTTFIDPVGGGKGIFTCDRCHSSSTIPPSNHSGSISDTAYHVNGRVDVVFSPLIFKSKAQLITAPDGWSRQNGYKTVKSYDETTQGLNTARYDPVTKTCSNVACHLSGIGGWGTTAGTGIRWGEKAVQCKTCHTEY